MRKVLIILSFFAMSFFDNVMAQKYFYDDVTKDIIKIIDFNFKNFSYNYMEIKNNLSDTTYGTTNYFQLQIFRDTVLSNLPPVNKRVNRNVNDYFVDYVMKLRVDKYKDKKIIKPLE